MQHLKEKIREEWFKDQNIYNRKDEVNMKGTAATKELESDFRDICGIILRSENADVKPEFQ